MINVAQELKVAINTGKVLLGSRETIKALLNGSAKMVIVAKDAPTSIRQDIEYYGKLSGTPIYVFGGNTWELGTACGRPHRVAALAVIDPGESNILSLVQGE